MEQIKLHIISGVAERIIINISEENNYISKIRRNIGSDYAYVTKVLGQLEEYKIIKREVKVGRCVRVKLTDKGKDIQFHLQKISELLL